MTGVVFVAKSKDESSITIQPFLQTVTGLRRAGLNATIPLIASEMGVKVEPVK